MGRLKDATDGLKREVDAYLVRHQDQVAKWQAKIAELQAKVDAGQGTAAEMEEAVNTIEQLKVLVAAADPTDTTTLPGTGDTVAGGAGDETDEEDDVEEDEEA